MCYRKGLKDHLKSKQTVSPPVDAFQTPALAPVTAELAARTLARRSLLFFTRKTHPDYTPGWVHADICKRLERFSEQVRAKKRPRLMLLMPPRHGKSELASIRFPAWHLGHAPDHEVINVGYNLDLPMRFSRRVRELFRDPLYASIFPQARLDPDSQSIEAWNTTAGGGLTAAGVGGGITGKGAHVLIVDDPLKNIEEADSAQTRDGLWDWYLSTAYTRLAPGGGVLLIETWWNDDDLAGRLQDAARADPLADQYEIVKYPAIAEGYEYRDPASLVITRFPADAPPDPALTQGLEFLRAPGDVLHPERYDRDQMDRIRATQSPRLWSALYQQNPVPDEGMYFRKDYFRYLPSLPPTAYTHLYSAWDLAIGEKSMNDWTVGATISHDSSDVIYVRDVTRFRGDSFAIVEQMLDVAEGWMRLPLTSYVIGVEDGQIWRAIKPLLERRMAERKLYPTIEVLKPFTDKIARARPLQGRMQQGRVVFPQHAQWLSDVEQELLRFPAGAHDDIVDALAWAIRVSMEHQPPVPRSKEAGYKSWTEQLEVAQQLDVGHMSA